MRPISAPGSLHAPFGEHRLKCADRTALGAATQGELLHESRRTDDEHEQ